MKLSVKEKELFQKKLTLQRSQLSKNAKKEIHGITEAYEKIEDLDWSVRETFRWIKSEGKYARTLKTVQLTDKPKTSALHVEYSSLVYIQLEMAKLEETLATVNDGTLQYAFYRIRMDYETLLRNQKAKHKCKKESLLLMKDILRLQAALGIKLNSQYPELIESLFHDVYSEITQDSYFDYSNMPLEEEKIKKQSNAS